MDSVFALLGYPNLPASQMLVIAGLAWASSLCLAWIADAILGDGVFGVMLNALILFGGAVLGVLLWRKIGIAAPAAQTMAIVATGSGIALLLALATLRRWI